MKKDKPEMHEDPRGMKKEDVLIHREARVRFDEIMDLCREERELCREDRRFAVVHGAQWEGDYADQYENKPRIEVNKTRLAIVKIKSAARENPITCDFVSRDGKETDALASVCDGLYRSDEQDSNAREARDTGFEEAITGGFGAYRLRTAWEDPYDEDDDRQRIEWDLIEDADQRVFFDPNAKGMMKKNAMYAFVLHPYTREAYEAKFDDPVSEWPKEYYHSQHYDWVTDTQVFVAEYYRVEEETVLFEWYVDVGESEMKYEASLVTDEMKAEFEAVGTKLSRSRNVKRRVVMKYLLSGAKVLGSGGERIAGHLIPIVPCYGERVMVDNIERLLGHVRLAKDPQRLKNMQTSRLAELAAKSTIGKPIFHPEQVAGLEAEWADDLTEDYPYLRVHPMTDAEGNTIASGPISYTKAPDIPPGLAAILQLTDQDLDDILGQMEGGDQLRSNVSGDAVEQIHSRLDMQSFIYISNMAKSVQYDGEIWLGMARDIYTDDGRTMKSVTPEGNTATVIINRPTIAKDGSITSDTDISRAKFNVYTNVAPASASRKASTVRNLTNMIKAGIGGDQESQIVLQLLAMMNMEGEGIGDLRDYATMRLVRMNIIDPSDEQAEQIKKEQEDKANQPPDPSELFLKSEGEKATAQAEEARARTTTARANSRKAIADTQKIEAQTIAQLAAMTPEERNAALATYQQMKEIGAQSVGIDEAEALPQQAVDPNLQQEQIQQALQAPQIGG